MVRKSVAVVVSLLVAASLLAAQTKDKEQQKDTKDAKEVKATVVKVDADKKTLTVKMADGKTQTLTIGDDTKFIGPRGGVSTDKLKDDRLTVGAEVGLVMGTGGKTVKEVHLPVRKSGDKKEAEKKPAEKK